MKTKKKKIKSDYKVKQDDNIILVDTSSNPVTVTLPSTGGYTIRAMNGSNEITVTPSGEKIIIE